MTINEIKFVIAIINIVAITGLVIIVAIFG